MFSDYELHPRLLQAVEAYGIKEPTEVQKSVIPAALKGADLEVSAETGSGKTLAYLLPLFEKLMAEASARSGSRALILLPTRELAQQTFKECSRLSDYTKTKSVLIIGGQETRYQASLLRRDPDIIVATPGRLIEHINRKNAVLDDIETLILDEADRMLDMGFRDEVLEIVERCNPNRQSVLLSATLNHKGVLGVAKQILNKPETHDLANAQTRHVNITQQMLLSDHPEHKRKQLLWLLHNRRFDKAVVFANKRVSVSALNDWLRDQGIGCNVLHGEISQDERKHIMNQFRQNRFNVLVATDVAARGLDIKGVDLVINFDMAHSGDEYVHRIGRTGRAGESGTAISLIADYEWNLAAGIQRYLRQQFEMTEVPGLTGKYKGPKKLKSSGKAVGKKPANKAKSKKAADKGRHRDKKNIGKRRSASKSKRENKAIDIPDSVKSGMAPPKRK